MKKIIFLLLAACVSMTSVGSIVDVKASQNMQTIDDEGIMTRIYGNSTFEFHFLDGNTLEPAFLIITDNDTHEITKLVRNGNKVYMNEGLNMVEIATFKESVTDEGIMPFGNWTTNEIPKVYNFELTPLTAATEALIFGALCMYNAFVGWTSVFINAISVYYKETGNSVIKITIFYKEYVGCPQYKHYTKQEAVRKDGTKLKTVYTDDYIFTGVTHSPENLPICRELGF